MGNTAISPVKEFEVNLLMIGDSGTGKTSLLIRNLSDEFIEDPENEETFSKVNTIIDGYPCVLNIREESSNTFNTLDTSKIPWASIIALTFDFSNHTSWVNIPQLIHILKQNSYKNNHLLIVGCKYDLVHTVNIWEVEQLVTEYPEFQIEYIETSALSNINVEQVFTRATHLGISSCDFKWERIKGLLFVYKYATWETFSEFSMVNLCESLPSFIGKKLRRGPIMIGKYHLDVIQLLIQYL